MTPFESAAAVIESISDPVFLVDRDGVLAGANNSAAELAGLPKSSFIGKPFADVLDAAPAEVEAKLVRWRRGREPVPGTLSFRTPSGPHKCICEAAAVPLGSPGPLVSIRCRQGAESTRRFIALEDRIQALAHEIRERQKTEQALRESERRFRGIFEHASEAILIAGEEGLIVEANPAACDLVGRPIDELAHLRVSDLTPPPNVDHARELWHAFIESGSQQGYFQILRPDGEIRDAEYSAVRNFIEGRHLSILRDVTERQRAASERDRQADALARSNAELEQFVYVASHDLQEPLRTISSFLQLAERRLGAKLDAESADYMALVRSAVHRLQRIILDLLEFSRLGTADRERASVDLNGVIELALGAAHSAIVETGAQVAAGALPVVEGDATQLYQLFVNLLSNALKFRSTKPRIEIRGVRRGGEWVIAVSDNGPGIEPEYFDRIFEPFRRLHGPEIPGSGIGLAIAKRIVENHRGRIWVESRPPAGSTFYVALPATK